MIAPELVHTLQQLNREEKLQIIQFLRDDLSYETEEHFKDGETAMLPLIRAPESAISVIEQLERETQADG